MSIKARVIGEKKGLLELETISSPRCEGCTSCSKGKSGLKFLAKSEKIYPLNSIVDVDMPSGDLNAAAFLVYGLPLLILLAGLFGGSWIFAKTALADKAELLGFVTGLAMAAIYYFFMRKNQDYVNRDGRFTATVLGLSKEDLCQF